LFQTAIKLTTDGWSVAPSGDGQRFLVNAYASANKSAPLTIILNWPAVAAELSNSRLHRFAADVFALAETGPRRVPSIWQCPLPANLLIEGLIWKDLRATFGTRLAEAVCDAFTIAQLLGHSDVRVTMRYVRAVETSKRVAVESVRLNFGKVGHFLVSWPKQPPLPAAVND
jgi:integrase